MSTLPFARIESPELNLLAAKLCLQSALPNSDLFWNKELQELTIHFWDDDSRIVYAQKTQKFRKVASEKSKCL